MRPISKFMVVKAVVFFTWWQGYSLLLMFLFLIKLCRFFLALLAKFDIIQGNEDYSATEIVAGLQVHSHSLATLFQLL
jgi:hypothetical protein